ncbi:MAG: hypothetical protein ACR2H6_06250 [Pyrinomonadaceae bacterium]
MQEIPIACNLTSSELRRRRAEVLPLIKAAVTDVKEIEGGYKYAFKSTPERIAQLANLVQLEHECCPFIRFCLTIEPGDGPLLLELTGPDGTKDFLKALFE